MPPLRSSGMSSWMVSPPPQSNGPPPFVEWIPSPVESNDLDVPTGTKYVSEWPDSNDTIVSGRLPNRDGDSSVELGHAVSVTWHHGIWPAKPTGISSL